MTERQKFKRSRAGCWTCKTRRKKCDEAKPFCNNCFKSGRECLGYDVLLAFDVDNDNKKVAYKRPNLQKSLAARGVDLLTTVKNSKKTHTFVYVDGETLNQSMDLPMQYLPQKKMDSVPFTKAFSNYYEHISDFNKRESGQQNDDNEIDDVSLDNLLDNLSSISNFDFSALSPPDIQQPSLVKSDEYFVKYFMNHLLPMFDNLEDSPFPKLVLKYCDSKFAKSCFVSLSSIHLYETDKNFNDYHQGIQALDEITNNFLSLFSFEDCYIADRNKIADNNDDNDDEPVKLIVEKLKNLPEKARISRVLTILIIIYVHIMFCVVESGRSAISEFLFKLSSCITYDMAFRDLTLKDPHVKFLISILGWFETFTTLVSPKIRRPFIRVFWWERQHELWLRTDTFTGCPDCTFSRILDILELRYELHNTGGSITNSFELKKEKLVKMLIDYRKNGISFNRNWSNSEFLENLHRAQCWSLCSLIYLYQLIPDKVGNNDTIQIFAKEFLFAFKQLGKSSRVRKQMIWPLFKVGEVVKAEEDQKLVLEYFDVLYQKTSMGNIRTLENILKRIWVEEITLDEILTGDEWLKSGISLLAF